MRKILLWDAIYVTMADIGWKKRKQKKQNKKRLKEDFLIGHHSITCVFSVTLIYDIEMLGMWTPACSLV